MLSLGGPGQLDHPKTDHRQKTREISPNGYFTDVIVGEIFADSDFYLFPVYLLFAMLNYF
jgi:hypothetical protein